MHVSVEEAGGTPTAYVFQQRMHRPLSICLCFSTCRGHACPRTCGAPCAPPCTHAPPTPPPPSQELILDPAFTNMVTSYIRGGEPRPPTPPLVCPSSTADALADLQRQLKPLGAHVDTVGLSWAGNAGVRGLVVSGAWADGGWEGGRVAGEWVC